MDRQAKACEERVGKRERESNCSGGQVRQPETARDQKNDRREDGQVHAGDDQQVEAAGAFETDAGGVLEVGAVAGEHGGEHACVCVGEPEQGGEALLERELGHGDDAVAGAGLECVEAAGEGWAGLAQECGFAGGGRAEGADALFVQVSARIPDAWVDITLLGVQGDCDAQEGAAGESRQGYVEGCVEGEAEAAGERHCADADEAQIESLGLLFVSLMSEERGVAGAARRLNAGDLTCDDALGTVCQLRELPLRLDGWLEGAREGAEEQEERAERGEHDAHRSMVGEQGKDDKCRDCEQQATWFDPAEL